MTILELLVSFKQMSLMKGILSCLLVTFAAVSGCVILGFWKIVTRISASKAEPLLLRKADYTIIWWSLVNQKMIQWLGLSKITIDIDTSKPLDLQKWYLIFCNHQTWVDILILQTSLLQLIAPIKFFTKSQLKWVPFIGIAMYGLDFPYVKRATREQIKANPALATLDRDNIFEACERFKNHPTCILNFLEGTRFSPAKHQQRNSKYKHLLAPKTGGASYVLEAMHERLDSILDITIYYPEGVPTFWDFLSGKNKNVIMQIKDFPIPEQSGSSSSHHKREVQSLVEKIWEEKDLYLQDLNHESLAS